MLSEWLIPIVRSPFWDRLIARMRSDRFRRQAGAVFISVTCHLIVVMLFLVHGNDRLRGDASRTLEGVQGDGDAAVLPIDLKLIRAQAEGQSSRAAAPKPPSVAAKATVAAADTTEASAVATATEEAQPSDAMPADSVAAGQADGEQDILAQIARCLPDGVRPALAAKLDLVLDAHGKLTAAPRLEVSADAKPVRDVKDENLVIQAVLQCGPYSISGGGGSFAIAANFAATKSP